MSLPVHLPPSLSFSLTPCFNTIAAVIIQQPGTGPDRAYVIGGRQQLNAMKNLILAFWALVWSLVERVVVIALP